MWKWRDPVIVELQRALKRVHGITSEKCCSCLLEVFDRQLWRNCSSAANEQFASFPAFVVHKQPYGLGLETQKGAQFFRLLVLAEDRLDIWAPLLAHIRVRDPGRPKTHVMDEIFRPFYHVSSATNAIDRRLVRLEDKHPDLHAQVCARALTLAEAEILAGHNRKRTAILPTYIKEFQALDPASQFDHLTLMWSAADQSTRLKFLATVSSTVPA